MKKFAIPMLIGLILTMFAFTACDEPILADEDTWYEFETNIYETDVLVYAYYSQSTIKTGPETVKPGLTFIVAPKKDLALGVSAKFYTLKTFSNNEVVVDENDEDAKKGLKASGTALDIIYTACRAKKIPFTSKKTPKPLEGSGWSTTEDLSKIVNIQNLTWKSLVKELVNSVL